MPKDVIHYALMVILEFSVFLQVNRHEIIDIDIDEESSDLMVLDEKIDRNKGKAIKNVSDDFFSYRAKVTNPK